jgi:peptidoglycan/xylan/chitin deacetylase (PgdA/CDA1 family)
MLPNVKIGSHGKSHIDLTKCDEKILEKELVYSKKYLEDLLGKTVDSISFPYGASNIKVKTAAEAAGYSKGLCSRFDINHPSRDPLMLNRCVILKNDSIKVLNQKIMGGWDWYKLRHRDPLLS